MIISRRALQRLSLLGLIASPLLSPAVADAIAGVEKFGRSAAERSRILTEVFEASSSSAFLLGKPGTSYVLGFEQENCDTNVMLKMV